MQGTLPIGGQVHCLWALLSLPSCVTGLLPRAMLGILQWDHYGKICCLQGNSTLSLEALWL